VIQAGERNYQSTTLANGFADHPAALSGNAVRYYGHWLASARASP